MDSGDTNNRSLELGSGLYQSRSFSNLFQGFFGTKHHTVDQPSVSGMPDKTQEEKTETESKTLPGLRARSKSHHTFLWLESSTGFSVTNKIDEEGSESTPGVKSLHDGNNNQGVGDSGSWKIGEDALSHGPSPGRKSESAIMFKPVWHENSLPYSGKILPAFMNRGLAQQEFGQQRNSESTGALDKFNAEQSSKVSAVDQVDHTRSVSVAALPSSSDKSGIMRRLSREKMNVSKKEMNFIAPISM